MLILRELNSYFVSQYERYDPYQKLFVRLILRSARDWFQGKDVSNVSTNPKARTQADHAQDAYRWFMSDDSFIGVVEDGKKKKGSVTFLFACASLGLSPKRFRHILHTDTKEEFLEYCEHLTNKNNRSGDSAYFAWGDQDEDTP